MPQADLQQARDRLCAQILALGTDIAQTKDETAATNMQLRQKGMVEALCILLEEERGVPVVFPPKAMALAKRIAGQPRSPAGEAHRRQVRAGKDLTAEPPGQAADGRIAFLVDSTYGLGTRLARHTWVLDHDHGALTGPHRHDLATGVWIDAASQDPPQIEPSGSESYRLVEATLSIIQRLTETQFRCLEVLLGRQPERFKDWADSFHFHLPLDTSPQDHPAVIYATVEHLSFQLKVVLAQP